MGEPAHRLLFRAMCDEYGVQIQCRFGQVPEGEMGEVMEFLSAWSKEKQVLRAQQGARDGLRDRVKLRHLPANTRAGYGYRWDGSRFVPDDHYAVAEGIWQMLKEGKTDRGIAGVLTRAGVPTPCGAKVWNPRTIASIAMNPMYCGKKMGLRWEGVEPKTRRGQTYGKSATRLRQPQEMVLLGDIVEQPIVSPEEFEQIQARRAQNKAYGGRRIRPYLLSGFLSCGLCGRRYSGTGLVGWRFPYGYRCGGSTGPVGKPRCRGRLLPGPWLEEAVWLRILAFLEDPSVFLTEAEAQEVRSQQTAGTIREAIAGLERQMAQYASYRQRAYDGLVRGMTDEETYHRVVAGYKAHEEWLNEELERQRKDLEKAQREALTAETVRCLCSALRERLERASNEDKRFVLECLDTCVVAAPAGLTLELVVPEYAHGMVGTMPGFPAGGLGVSPGNSNFPFSLGKGEGDQGDEGWGWERGTRCAALRRRMLTKPKGGRHGA
ncbi:MAG: recombinase family protein [Chloroflexi bacterium]|nr:recombinase family protein [Chloroflexota bacterium]